MMNLKSKGRNCDRNKYIFFSYENMHNILTVSKYMKTENL